MTAPTYETLPRPVAACFGAGGAFGIGFNMGVADALQDSGIPIDRGPMLGTSAGAWSAAALALGVRADQIFETWERHPRGRTLARAIESASDLLGDVRDGRVGGVAIDLSTGRRVTLRGDRLRLADIVAASASAPGVTVPHRIGAVLYIDAGVASCASVDRAASARLLVVTAPMAGPAFGSVGWLTERAVRYEAVAWRQRTHGHILYVRPTRAFTAIIPVRSTDALLDVSVGRRTYGAAYELGQRCAQRFHARHPGTTFD